MGWRESKKRLRLLLHLEKKRKRNRVYISSLQACFRRLNQAGVNYLVLRWFEDYPKFKRTAKREDVDFLVADHDIGLFFEVMDNCGGRIPCDVYSESGIGEASFFGMPYFPPFLARRMLERRKMEKEMFYVPCEEDYFFSMTYHVVYHKNVLAGVEPGVDPEIVHISVSHNPKRNYGNKLAQMVADFKIPYSGRMTLLELHHFLKSQGWAMPDDTIRRWPIQTPWLKYLVEGKRKESSGHGEMAVFVIRRFAKEYGLVEDILATLRSRFEIIEIKELTEAEVEQTSRIARGGNWGPGPGPVSGGPPAVIVVCFDHHPQAIPEHEQERMLATYPLVRNMNVMIKHEIRDSYNARIPRKHHCSFVHSADNEEEAVEYTRIFFGDEADRILKRIDLLRVRQNAIIIIDWERIVEGHSGS